MIHIFIDGKEMDTSEDLSISFELNNDLFNMDDQSPRQFSYPVTLPPTPRNHKNLGWLKDINSTADWTTRYTAQITTAGVSLQAEAVITKASAKGYEVTFYVGKSGFKTAGDTLLSGIDWGAARKLIDPYTDQDDLLAEMLNIANNPEDYDFVFAPLNHANFYASPNFNDTNGAGAWTIAHYVEMSNYFLPGGTFYKCWVDISGPIVIWEETNYVPYLKLKYILKKIFEVNGYVLEDLFSIGELAALYLFNSYALDTNDNSSGYNCTVCGNEISPGNHVPAITVTDFLNGICRMFNIYQDFGISANKVKLICRKDIISSTEHDDWTGKRNGDFELSQPDRNQYGFRAAADPDEEYSTNVLEASGVLEYNAAENRQMIETPVSWCYTGFPEDPYVPGRFMRLDKVDQPGNSPLITDLGTENPYTPKLMFYRGMQPDDNSNDYPLISGGNLDSLNNVVGDYVMDWADPDYGLYTKFWAEWIAFMQTQKAVSVPLTLDITDIANLDLSKKKRIGTAMLLTKKLSFNLTHRGVRDAKGEFVKC